MTSTIAAPSLKVADEVFIVTALLHTENPERTEFTIAEILDRAARAGLTERLRAGVRVHAVLHCVANRAPNPATYRMLYAPAERTRRLLLAGDDVHPGRTGKIFPIAAAIPAEYQGLLEWAKRRFQQGGGRPAPWLQSIVEMRGKGKAFWRPDDIDAYVNGLRGDWQ